MIEVFKTNITNAESASEILDRIHDTFPDCRANFDLHDCDNILRVVCRSGTMDADTFIQFLRSCHCKAEILDHVIPSPRLILA